MVYVRCLQVDGILPFYKFYPQFFRIDVKDLTGIRGFFTPAHLWFIFYLTLFSFAAIPLFVRLKRNRAKAVLVFTGRFFRKGGRIFLLAVPPAAAALLPGLEGKNPFYFLYGFSTGTSSFPLRVQALLHLIYYFGIWYPFYLLHFIVNTAVGFLIIRLSLPIILKYSIIFYATTAITLFLYHYVVRRVPGLRFLLGVKRNSEATPTFTVDGLYRQEKAQPFR